MPSPFIPNADAAFDPWLLNFSTLIAGDPGAYGLSAPDAAEISAAYGQWHAAYLAARAPATRTSVAIRSKDERRRAAEAIVRQYAAVIRSSRGVSDALKINLGLRVRPSTFTRTSAPPPESRPLLSIIGITLGTHRITAADENSPARVAKPPGVAGMLVVRVVAEGPVRDAGEPGSAHPPASGAPTHHAEILGLITRARFESRFTADDGGKWATYFARWTNGKGQTGPWSAPVSMRIAA